jgi:hypothetical protein
LIAIWWAWRIAVLLPLETKDRRLSTGISPEIEGSA